MRTTQRPYSELKRALMPSTGARTPILMLMLEWLECDGSATTLGATMLRLQMQGQKERLVNNELFRL